MVRNCVEVDDIKTLCRLDPQPEAHEGEVQGYQTWLHFAAIDSFSEPLNPILGHLITQRLVELFISRGTTIPNLYYAWLHEALTVSYVSQDTALRRTRTRTRTRTSLKTRRR